MTALIAALTILTVSASWGIWYGERQDSLLCKGAAQKLLGVWDSSIKRQVHNAFMATQVLFADAAWQAVEKAFDGYSTSWVKMHSEACSATNIQKEQSPEVLDLRMACLQDLLGELKVLVNVFSEADAKVVKNAAQVAAGLSGIKKCADLEHLKARIKPPEDKATQEKLALVRKQLKRVSALAKIGKYREGLKAVNSVFLAAQELAYKPVLAEVKTQRGSLYESTGHYKKARAELWSAVLQAELSRHDELKARSLVRLVWVLANWQSRFKSGLRLHRFAKAIVTRLGNDDALLQRLK